MLLNKIYSSVLVLRWRCAGVVFANTIRVGSISHMYVSNLALRECYCDGDS